MANPNLSSEQLKAQFTELDTKLGAETRFDSIGLQTIEHPAYRQIISLGEAAVPLLLEGLRNHPSHRYFYALDELVGLDIHQDATDPEGLVNLEEVRLRWLAWGEQEGYLSPKDQK